MPAPKEPDKLRLKLSPKKIAISSKTDTRTMQPQNLKSILKRHEPLRVGDQQNNTSKTIGDMKTHSNLDNMPGARVKGVAKIDSGESDSGDSKTQDTVGETSFQNVMKKKVAEEVVRPSWIQI